jgi:hypothetical protein
MVSIKQAFVNAAEFAASVLEPARLTDLRLEEVETAEVGGADVWLITMSMVRPSPLSPLAALNDFKGFPRDYKIFTIRKDTGEVLSMKIRELAGT